MLSKITQNTFKHELKKQSFVLGDDLVFPKATVDPRLLKLQQLVTGFVTSVILKHERDFYQLVENHYPSKKNSILTTTNSSVIEMIMQTTSKFYNKLYHGIQQKMDSDLIESVVNMCEFADYGPHILLDKMIRLTLEIHLDIWRENLLLADNNCDVYEKTILIEINKSLLSLNLLHILSKGIDEDGPFVIIPEGENAFDVVIDKNILI